MAAGNGNTASGQNCSREPVKLRTW